MKGQCWLIVIYGYMALFIKHIQFNLSKDDKNETGERCVVWNRQAVVRNWIDCFFFF